IWVDHPILGSLPTNLDPVQLKREIMRLYALRKRGSTEANATLNGEAVTPGDPNELVGTQGVGVPGWVSGTQPLHYSVIFDNDPRASAAAQDIIVTDHLDPIAWDLTTVHLEDISFD